MSSPKPGPYIISPKDAPKQSLIIGPIPLPYPIPDVPVRVAERPFNPWFLRNSKDNTFNVFAGGGNQNDFKWITDKDNTLIASVTKKPDDFRFESAGNNLWVIGIPGKDLLLTFSNDGERQLTFKPADGSSAQRFELVEILRG